jgi:agmatinase
MTPREELATLLKPAGGGLYLVSTGRAQQQAFMRRYYDARSDEDVTEKFLDQLARIAGARVVVLGIPSDVGAGFRRGANLGPEALRAAWLEADASLPRSWEAQGVIDIGDVFVVPQLLHDAMLSERQLRRSQDALYPDLDEAARRAMPVSPLSAAERALSLVLQLNPHAKPLMLGGDHSTAWPVVKALHDAGRRFCIVQIDAHTDLLAERLGVALCFATWSYHANELIGRGGRLIQAGIRATRHPREHWESTLGVRQFWLSDFDSQQALADAVVEAARASGLPVYLSNDIDGTDACVADATGTPEPEGLSVDTVRTIIERLGQPHGWVGADLVEVAPLLGADGGQRTLAASVQYLQATLAGLLASR